MTSRTELKAHCLKYIDYILHPPRRALVLAIPTHRHGAAGVGILIPDIDLEERVHVSNWTNITYTKSVALPCH